MAKQPATPTSVLEPTPSSPASSAASSVAGSVTGEPRSASAPAEARAEPQVVVPPAVLVHRRSAVIAYRRRGAPIQAPPDLPPSVPNTWSQGVVAVVTLALFFG